MGYILKFGLPNWYTTIIVAKIRKGFLRNTERVKGFFIVATMRSLKQVKPDYSKKEPYK